MYADDAVEEQRPSTEMCPGCSLVLESRPAFRLGDAAALTCLRCALTHPPLLRRSALIGALIGSLLVAINQGDLLLAGDWRPALAWKVPLTYLVPFLVATLGALLNTRAR